MPKTPPYFATALTLCAASLLAACATPARVAVLPVRTAAPQPDLISGTVVAIRPVTASSALTPGSAAVLAALQITPPAQAPNATEFVIKRDDGDVATMVVRSPAASPGASLSAANFTVGDQVELITGPQTELIHREP